MGPQERRLSLRARQDLVEKGARMCFPAENTEVFLCPFASSSFLVRVLQESPPPVTSLSPAPSVSQLGLHFAAGNGAPGLGRRKIQPVKTDFFM